MGVFLVTTFVIIYYEAQITNTKAKPQVSLQPGAPP